MIIFDGYYFDYIPNNLYSKLSKFKGYKNVNKVTNKTLGQIKKSNKIKSPVSSIAKSVNDSNVVPKVTSSDKSKTISWNQALNVSNGIKPISNVSNISSNMTPKVTSSDKSKTISWNQALSISNKGVKPTSNIPNVSNNVTQSIQVKDSNSKVPNSLNNSQVKGSQVNVNNSTPKVPNSPNNSSNSSKPNSNQNSSSSPKPNLTQSQKNQIINSRKIAGNNRVKTGIGTTLAGGVAGAIAVKALLGKNASASSILAGAGLGAVGVNMMGNQVNRNLNNKARADANYIRNQEKIKAELEAKNKRLQVKNMQLKNRAQGTALDRNARIDNLKNYLRMEAYATNDPVRKKQLLDRMTKIHSNIYEYITR